MATADAERAKIRLDALVKIYRMMIQDVGLWTLGSPTLLDHASRVFPVNRGKGAAVRLLHAMSLRWEAEANYPGRMPGNATVSGQFMLSMVAGGTSLENQIRDEEYRRVTVHGLPARTGASNSTFTIGSLPVYPLYSATTRNGWRDQIHALQTIVLNAEQAHRHQVDRYIAVNTNTTPGAPENLVYVNASPEVDEQFDTHGTSTGNERAITYLRLRLENADTGDLVRIRRAVDLSALSEEMADKLYRKLPPVAPPVLPEGPAVVAEEEI